MDEILGKAKTVRELLSGTKYSIDYYQREYKWGAKQVAELIRDLTSKFLEDYERGHSREQVEQYGHYFLGSIIISRKNNMNYIIDGQQRLTSLTLLLIYLQNLQQGGEGQVNVEELIFSEKYARKSFNIDVEERTACMEALFEQRSFDDTEQTESVRNTQERYRDIEEQFPEELKSEALPYFVDWLIENVHLVVITAFSDNDAYTIFETMNDRGLSLSPVDMLKGYLLANIEGSDRRTEANNLWKKRVSQLADWDKGEDANLFKNWLRSQYAQSIRERKAGAQPEDFDRIGTEFHRWVRDNHEAIGVTDSEGYFAFIMREFKFYSHQYLRLLDASWKLTGGLEHVYYNTQLGFTLQHLLLLAPLKPDDSDDVVDTKIRIVARFLDILLTRRLWNFRRIGYTTMQYAMYLVMKDIRGKPPKELAATLRRRLDDQEETFDTDYPYYLHQQNRRYIHHLLARITDYIERGSGAPGRYEEYVTKSGKNRYEVEHIWSDHPEWHEDEFNHPHEFSEYRNRIGGLLLLPKSFNASYGDLPYEDKLEHYYSQNILAQTLYPKCYSHSPGFLRFKELSGLPFQAHKEFKKADLDARQKLYREIAKKIWNPELVDEEVVR